MDDSEGDSVPRRIYFVNIFGFGQGLAAGWFKFGFLLQLQVHLLFFGSESKGFVVLHIDNVDFLARTREYFWN